MFRVYQDDKPADCVNYDVHKSWACSLFETKRQAEIYAFRWAYPVDYDTAAANAPDMELDKPYDFGMTEFPIFMIIKREGEG